MEGLCLILDAKQLRTGAEQAAEEAWKGGVRIFQYRSKGAPRREVYEACRRVAAVLRDRGALFIVNDHADIALAVGAGGVHLGQDDLPIEHARRIMGRDRIIGISTHSVSEALAAERSGADYIGFGPMFPTTTKDAGPVQGPARLREIRDRVAVPIVAIGGIGPANVAETIRAGAAGAAVISAVLGAPDIGAAARDLVERIRSAGQAGERE